MRRLLACNTAHLRGAMVVVGLLVLIIISVVVFAGRPDPKPVTSTPEPVITHSTDTPDESKQRAKDYNWQGRAAEPKRIVIDKIAVDAFIQQVGVDQNKQIAVPSNVHLAAWFRDSVRPGEKGLAIVDGHVNGRVEDGVFKRLNQLRKGDVFTIERGDGKTLKYQVVATAKVPTAEAASLLFSQDPTVASQLSLITCDGAYNNQRQSYDERFIVSAALQP